MDQWPGPDNGGADRTGPAVRVPQGEADAVVQSLLKGDVLHLVVGRFRIDDIVRNRVEFGPLEIHCPFQHQLGTAESRTMELETAELGIAVKRF